jgi:hypothetical protein
MRNGGHAQNPEQTSLPNHTDRKEDAESDDKDSGNLMEAVNTLTPEDSRPSDEQSVDDELALHGSRDEQKQTDCGNQATPENVHSAPPVDECMRMTKGRHVWSLKD